MSFHENWKDNFIAFEESKPNFGLWLSRVGCPVKVIFWKLHIPVRTPKWPPHLIFAGICKLVLFNTKTCDHMWLNMWRTCERVSRLCKLRLYAGSLFDFFPFSCVFFAILCSQHWILVNINTSTVFTVRSLKPGSSRQCKPIRRQNWNNRFQHFQIQPIKCPVQNIEISPNLFVDWWCLRDHGVG